jgi:hypothetical protein
MIEQVRERIVVRDVNRGGASSHPATRSRGSNRRPLGCPISTDIKTAEPECSVTISRREPSWEPFAGDSSGRSWTPVVLKTFRSGLCALLWTLMDTAWRSTDQKVGGSSPSGRAVKGVVVDGHFYDSCSPSQAAVRSRLITVRVRFARDARPWGGGRLATTSASRESVPARRLRRPPGCPDSLVYRRRRRRDDRRQERTRSALGAIPCPLLPSPLRRSLPRLPPALPTPPRPPERPSPR